MCVVVVVVRVLDIRTDRFGDLKNVHLEVVYAAKWSQNGVRIWTDRFGDLKNVHPEVVYAAKWSQNGIRFSYCQTPSEARQ